MNVRVDFHNEFLRQAKRYRKKYRSFESDFQSFLCSIEKDPLQGTDLGNGIRKVRMPIKSKGKGKSGGARIITYTINTISDNELNLTLLTIYDKSEIESISEDFIDWLITQIER